MNRKIKLALAAILGFSTACSSVKNAPSEREDAQENKQEAVTPSKSKLPRPQIVVMYGVRPPERGPVENVDLERKQTSTPQSQEIDPVVEKPSEE